MKQNPICIAKVTLNSLESHETWDSLRFSAVTNTDYGPNGENEDNTFARWTPTLDISMSITNPALLGKLKQGKKYYINFVEAEGE